MKHLISLVIVVPLLGISLQAWAEDCPKGSRSKMALGSLSLVEKFKLSRFDEPTKATLKACICNEYFVYDQCVAKYVAGGPGREKEREKSSAQVVVTGAAAANKNEESQAGEQKTQSAPCVVVTDLVTLPKTTFEKIEFSISEDGLHVGSLTGGKVYRYDSAKKRWCVSSGSGLGVCDPTHAEFRDVMDASGRVVARVEVTTVEGTPAVKFVEDRKLAGKDERSLRSVTFSDRIVQQTGYRVQTLATAGASEGHRSRWIAPGKPVSFQGTKHSALDSGNVDEVCEDAAPSAGAASASGGKAGAKAER